MANELRFRDGDLLFVGGDLAMHADCCCDEPPPDDCGLTGTRPAEIELTISSCNASYNGSHLLTNSGDEAAWLADTGRTMGSVISSSEWGPMCWGWWEPTGVNANEWYLVGYDVTNTGDVVIAIVRPLCTSRSYFTYSGTDWAGIDGGAATIFDFDSCGICTTGSAVVSIPP